MSATRRRRRSGGGLAFSPFARSNDDLLLDYDLQEQTGLVAHAWNRAVTVPDTRNVVVNGGFANWTGAPLNDTPDNWGVFGQDGVNNYVTDATNACRLVSDGTAIFIRQTVLEASKSYQVAITITASVSGSIVIGQAGQPSTQTTLTAVDTHIHNFTAVDGADFIVSRSSGATDITFTTVIIQQTNILASSAYPMAELLDQSGDGVMDKANWVAQSNANLTNFTEDGYLILRVQRDGTDNPFATQVVLTAEQRTLLQFQSRSDGSATAKGFIGTAGGGVQIDGTTSTAWESLSGEGDATNTNVGLMSLTSTGTEYVDFRVTSAKPANPLNADITAATLGVPTGLPLGYAMTFDGATTYISLLNALTELNSIINMQKGSIVAYINPTALGSDKVIFTIYVDANNWIKAHTEAAGTVTVEYRGAGTTSTASITGVVTGAWQQIALTWDTTADGGNGEFIGYLNESQSDTTQVIADEIVGNLTKAIMFADTDTPTLVFNGSGSQTIKLYVAAQSPSQVAELSRRAGTS